VLRGWENVHILQMDAQASTAANASGKKRAASKPRTTFMLELLSYLIRSAVTSQHYELALGFYILTMTVARQDDLSLLLVGDITFTENPFLVQVFLGGFKTEDNKLIGQGQDVPMPAALIAERITNRGLRRSDLLLPTWNEQHARDFIKRWAGLREVDTTYDETVNSLRHSGARLHTMLCGRKSAASRGNWSLQSSVMNTVYLAPTDPAAVPTLTDDDGVKIKS